MKEKSTVAAMPAPGGAGQQESPYLAARRMWDERYGDLISRAKNWRAIAFLAMGIMIVAVFGLIALSLRSKVVPYIVAIDTTGRVVSQGTATEAAVPDERVIHAALFDWVGQFRMVSSDAVVERAAIDKVYAMIGANSPAAIKVGGMFRSASPLDRATKEVVSVDIHSIYATSPQTYVVEWTEKTMDLQGNQTGTQNYKAALTVSVHPPQDESLARINPLGVYVMDIDVSKIL
jgi:type IV secretion system protein VirB5